MAWPTPQSIILITSQIKDNFMLLRLARIASFVFLASSSWLVQAAVITAASGHAHTQLPNFSTINSEKIATTLDAAINDYNQQLEQILRAPPSWYNTIQPLEQNNTNVRKTWNLLRHLNAVDNSAELQAVYDMALPKMLSFRTDLMHNAQIYQNYLAIKNSPEFAELNSQQQNTIEQMLREFKLSGAELSPAQQLRYREIVQKLGKLSIELNNNLRNAIKNWQYFIRLEQADMLDGVPEFIKKAAAQHAQKQNRQGWIITLDFNTVNGILTYAKSRELRKVVYTAYATIASDQDPDSKQRQWDNSANIEQMLQLRQELAQLLGYKNFAAYSLADKSEASYEVVLSFLEELAAKARPAARRDLDKLQAFAMSADSIDELKPWDINYYADWLKYGLYGVSTTELQAYLPAKQVTNGLFSLAAILYNIRISEVPNANVWDPTVKLYTITDQDNNPRGYFYLDLYSRAHKAPGSWTEIYTPRLLNSDNTLLEPITFVNTNVLQVKDELLTHNNVLQLFTEFGEMLQYNLSLNNYPSISGPTGWQKENLAFCGKFMQHWGWQPKVLEDISKNINSAKNLPQEIIDKLVGARKFNAGLHLANEIERSILDLKLHADLGTSPLEIQQQVRKQYHMGPTLAQDRPLNRTEYLFLSGFASGYYQAIMADVLAADAYAAFATSGYFNSTMGQQFMQAFLEQGGMTSTQLLFEQFRGRPPEIKYFLAEQGL